MRGQGSHAAIVAGRSAREIAKALGGGITRNAVIGRSRRLRGIVYQSDILSWDRANAKAVSGGTLPGKAMGKAFKAGARWRQIGDYFDMSPQAAYEAAKRARGGRR